MDYEAEYGSRYDPGQNKINEEIKFELQWAFFVLCYKLGTLLGDVDTYIWRNMASRNKSICLGRLVARPFQ